VECAGEECEPAVRLLVTGAHGMLGSDFVRAGIAIHHEVHGVAREDCDITNREAVRLLVEKQRPEAVIHCAAHTDVDDCAKNPGKAHLINAHGASNLAQAVRGTGGCLVYISTSGVFDGSKTGPYVETDKAAPRTEYGRSKLEGENRVISSGCDHLIVRASWLFGGDPELRKNFVAARKREAEGKQAIESATDKRGSPTWTRDFALKTVELLSARARGLFHVSNFGVATRFEYVSAIMSLFQLKTPVKPVDSSRFPRTASVPANESMASVKLSKIGVRELRPWREALSSYIAQFNNGAP
jgi:dTDP-4-dehydrorhamnose reductase